MGSIRISNETVKIAGHFKIEEGLTLVGQIELLHARHVHLELGLVAEQILAVAGCVGVGCAA